MKKIAVKRHLRRAGSQCFRAPTLEAEFRATCRQASLRIIYISAGLTALSLFLFITTDFLLYGWSFLAKVSLLRYILALVLLVFGIGIQRWPDFVNRHHYKICFIYSLAVAYGAFYIEYISQISGHIEFTYTSVIAICLILVFTIYGFPRLPITLAAPLTMLVSWGPFLCVFPQSYSFYGTSRMWSYIVIANLMGFILHRITEMNDRYVFLQNERLARSASLRLRTMQHELANEAKTRFLAMISHELRTPIAGIMGIANLLHDEVLQKQDPEKFKLCGTLLSSCEHVLETFNDVIDYAKDAYAHRDKVIHNEKFDLGQLLHTTCDLFIAQRSDKKINFTLDISSAQGIYLESDPSKLMRVLINLLSNAWKFTPAQGQVICRCECLVVGPHMGLVSLIVSDSGIGIAKDQLHKIWQPFYRVEAFRSQPAQGTGLGLAICKELVDSLGGQISCTSILEYGSTFTVNLHLPMQIALAHTQPPTAGELGFRLPLDS